MSMAFSTSARNLKEECFGYPIHMTSTDPPGVHVAYCVSHRFKVFREGTDLRVHAEREQWSLFVGVSATVTPIRFSVTREALDAV